jgi:hypothetical protein
MADPPDIIPDDEPADAAAGGRRSRKPFLLRIPPELMEDLRGWAASELRSLNGHIEYLLREAVKRRKR